MYRPENKTPRALEIIKAQFYGIARKFILIIVAVMIGISNSIYEEDKMIDLNKNRTEQEDPGNTNDEEF
ncbi:MAG TPA: hypothetical protein VKN36_01280 [Eudoraea sp.]|nr:hypothetical protein [Eudoraea sp.]